MVNIGGSVSYVDEGLEHLGHVRVVDPVEVLEDDGLGDRVDVAPDVGGGQDEHGQQVGPEEVRVVAEGLSVRVQQH